MKLASVQTSSKRKMFWLISRMDKMDRLVWAYYVVIGNQCNIRHLWFTNVVADCSWDEWNLACEIVHKRQIYGEV